MYQGNTWIKEKNIQSNNNEKYFNIAYNGSTGIICGSNGTLQISKDGGTTWTKSKCGKAALQGLSYNGNTWMAMTWDREIYISCDNGDTWTPKNKNNNTFFLDVVCCGNTWIAVGKDVAIYISKDNGSSWIKKEHRPGSVELNSLMCVACSGNKCIAMGGEKIYFYKY